MRRVVVRIGLGVRRAAASVGAALGIERRLDLDYPCPKAPDHRLNDVIAPDP
jgi:hypothetical protein